MFDTGNHGWQAARTIHYEETLILILDSFKLDGKRALVTGASAGLGQAMAIALAEAGCNVACHGNSRAPETTCAQIEKLNRRAFAVKGDLSQPHGADEVFRQTTQGFGAIDILVNNAGTIRRAATVDYTADDWAFVLQVNLTSAWRLAQLAGGAMLKQASGGKIINIASLLSFQGGVTVPAYTASKHGIAGLTKALANEWARHNINVNAIAPGYMRTTNTEPLQQDETRNRQILERIPAGRWGEADDVAGAVVFLASRASDYLHGHILTVDGGWLGR